MIDERQRISKIVDEMMMFFFSMGAKDVSANVRLLEGETTITMTSDYSGDQKKNIEKLIKCMKIPKQEGMEEYFWGLTGECNMDTELSIVGMMTDRTELDVTSDSIRLVLYRKA